VLTGKVECNFVGETECNKITNAGKNLVKLNPAYAFCFHETILVNTMLQSMNSGLKCSQNIEYNI